MCQWVIPDESISPWNFHRDIFAEVGKLRLGELGYPIAIEFLTYTAIHGGLDYETVRRYEMYFSAQDSDGIPSVEHVLHVLHHDGYLEKRDDGTSQFVSGLLEDWWSNRYGQNFLPVIEPQQQDRGTEQ